jgi:SAM-dependent methyltransferase
MPSPQKHWESVYESKADEQVSWFEPLPAISLEMMTAAGLTPETCVIDVGGGESRLVDTLLAQGLDCLAVLDVSATALGHARARIGAASEAVTWLAADITGDWTLKPMDIWHDRAVFHFLMEPDDRERYRQRLRATLKVGGTAIVATFATDGPEKCSGLPVVRYSPETLTAELGDGFTLVDAKPHRHITPWGSAQSFQYSRLQRIH